MADVKKNVTEKTTEIKAMVNEKKENFCEKHPKLVKAVKGTLLFAGGFATAVFTGAVLANKEQSKDPDVTIAIVETSETTSEEK